MKPPVPEHPLNTLEDDRDTQNDRYRVLSANSDDPEDVSEWCATSTFWKAEAVFALLKIHRQRLELPLLALMDGNTILTSDHD